MSLWRDLLPDQAAEDNGEPSALPAEVERVEDQTPGEPARYFATWDDLAADCEVFDVSR